MELFEKASLVDWLTFACAAIWALVKLGEWKHAHEGRRKARHSGEGTVLDAQLEVRFMKEREETRHWLRGLLANELGSRVSRHEHSVEHEIMDRRIDRLERTVWNGNRKQQ
jgi:hypothetical protein